MTTGQSGAERGPGVVRVVRLDGVGADEGAATSVARLDAAPAEDRVAAASVDLAGVGDIARDAAPVASFEPEPEPEPEPGSERVAGAGAVPTAAPLALFDSAQIEGSRAGVPVAELDAAALRRGGRRASGQPRSRAGDERGSGSRTKPNRAAGSTAARAVDAGTGGPDAADTAPAGYPHDGGPADTSGPADGADGRRSAPAGPADGRRSDAQSADARSGDARSGGARSDGGNSRRPRGGPPAELDPDADPLAVARSICLRLLTDRARTRQELAQALQRKGVPNEAADAVLERFGEVGLIDDAAFAGQWVRSRHAGRGLGRHALAVELRRKGVNEEVAGEALAEVDSDAEALRARQLVDRKLRSMPADTGEQRVVAGRRLAGMLARKGYGAGVAYRVVREALAARGAEIDELGDTDPHED